MKKTKMISLMLSLAVLLSALGGFTVFAESEICTESIPNVFYDSTYDDSYYTENLGISLSAYESLKQTVAAGVLNCTASISISGYGIKRTDDTIDGLSSLVYKNDPRFFNIKGFAISRNPSTNTILSLEISYLKSKSEFDSMLAACDASVEAMIGDLKTSALSDAEKALLVHDRLAVLNEYDTTYNLPNTHDMYGALVVHKSVCEGYAQAFCYAMDNLGIKSYMVVSDTLNHAWNIVYIDGKKYHVDVTWDDPIIDMTGRVFHNNFLLSTNALYNAGTSGHKATDYDSSPTDTTYDTYYWQDSSAEFRYLDGKLYYIDGKNNTLNVRENGISTALISVNDRWYASGGGYWSGNYAKLSGNKRYLFYSLSKAIYRFDPATGTSEVAYQYVPSSSGFNVYGFKADDSYFYIVPNSSPNFSRDTKELYGFTYEYTDPAPVQIIYGDLTDDGEINSIDASVIFKYDAGMLDLTPEQFIIADVNGDSLVDAMDASLILKLDAGLIDHFPVESN